MRQLVRRPPPLWVMLDVLLVWILVLVNQPNQESGVRYKFLGLPPGSTLFAVHGPIRTDQQRWEHFDFETQLWMRSEEVTPFGHENFLCDDCAAFLPKGAEKPKGLMISLSRGTEQRIHTTFFEACSQGDCSPTILIAADGSIDYRH